MTSARTRPRELDDRVWLEEQYQTQSLRQIGESLGCSMQTVSRACRRHGIPRRPAINTNGRPNPPADAASKYPELNDKTWLRGEYVDKSKSTTDIAMSTGCSKSAVQLALKRHGIPARQRGARIPQVLKRLKERYDARRVEVAG